MSIFKLDKELIKLTNISFQPITLDNLPSIKIKAIWKYNDEYGSGGNQLFNSVQEYLEKLTYFPETLNHSNHSAAYFLFHLESEYTFKIKIYEYRGGWSRCIDEFKIKGKSFLKQKENVESITKIIQTSKSIAEIVFYKAWKNLKFK